MQIVSFAFDFGMIYISVGPALTYIMLRPCVGPCIMPCNLFLRRSLSLDHDVPDETIDTRPAAGGGGARGGRREGPPAEYQPSAAHATRQRATLVATPDVVSLARICGIDVTTRI